MSSTTQMITTETRRASYEMIKPKLSYLQKKTYEIIAESNQPLSASDIALVMYVRGIANSSERCKAAPRCSELDLVYGVITPYGTKNCEKTGRPEAIYITTLKYLDILKKENETKTKLIQPTLFACGVKT